MGDVLSEMIWRQLRERSGVTYGAYAYPIYYDGGTAMLAGRYTVGDDHGRQHLQGFVRVLSSNVRLTSSS